MPISAIPTGSRMLLWCVFKSARAIAVTICLDMNWANYVYKRPSAQDMEYVVIKAVNSNVGACGFVVVYPHPKSVERYRYIKVCWRRAVCSRRKIPAVKDISFLNLFLGKDNCCPYDKTLVWSVDSSARYSLP